MLRTTILLLALAPAAAFMVMMGGDFGVIGSRVPPALDEDPRMRAEFEWLRLRDPRTGRIPRTIRRDEYAYARTLPTRVGWAMLKGSAAPGYEWTPRGPSNMGGRTRALAIDRTNPSVLIAGGVTGGMWRSTDRGGTWARTTTKGQMPSVTCVAQDPRPGYGNVWYYGTGEGRTNSTRFGSVGLLGDGIFRSIDSGKTWEELSSTVTGTPQALDGPFDIVWEIAVDATGTGPGEIYVAGAGRVMRSTNGGATWSTALGDSMNGAGFTGVTVTSTGVVYAAVATGSQKGVWRSPDGVAWSRISPAAWPDSTRRILLAVAPSNERMLYAFCESPGFGTIVEGSYGFDEYYSIWNYRYIGGDGSGAGGEWDDRSDNIPMLGNAWDYNGLHSYTMLLKVHLSNPDIVYMGGTNLYRSDDGFRSADSTVWLGGYSRGGGWGADGQLHPDQHALVLDPDQPGVLLCASDGGVATAVDQNQGGLDWTWLNDGYITTQFYSVAIDQQTPGSPLLVGGLQDNGTPIVDQSDADAPWTRILGGDGSFCAVADSGRLIYASSQGGNIERIRIDSAGNSSDYAAIPPRGSSGYLFIAPFALDPADRRIMYLPAGNALWRNTNLDDIPFENGPRPSINWSIIHQVSGGGTISAVGVSTRNPGHRLYYGTLDGHLYRLDDAHSATLPLADDITDPAFPVGGYINCVAVDPQNADDVLVVFTNYGVHSLFHSDDGGATWTAVGGNLEENPDGSGRGPSCRWARIGWFNGERYIFVGTTVGLFSTTTLEGSATAWMLEGENTIGHVRIDMIDMREADGTVAVATWGNGMYTTTLPTSDIARNATESFALSAFPNPTRGEIAIVFTLSRPERIALTIHDAHGALVALLLNEDREAGEHRIPFDASRLPAGSYFYALRTNGRVVGERIAVQ